MLEAIEMEIDEKKSGRKEESKVKEGWHLDSSSNERAEGRMEKESFLVW